MTKLTTSVLVLALMASSGVAAAQDGGYRPEARRSVRNNPDQARPAPQSQPAPAAVERQADAPRARDDGDRRGGERGPRGGEQARPPQPQQQAQPDQRRDWNRDGRGQNSNQGDRQRGDWNGDRNDGRRDGDRRFDDRRDDRREGGRDWNGGRNDGRGWNDNRNQPRPRYDRRNYQPQWRSEQRYRGYTYRPPSGFYARNWGFGDLVPRGWWGTQYRLNDWWSFGLPIPPIGYEWVRVGDDALLIDMYNGRVVQVARDLFW